MIFDTKESYMKVSEMVLEAMIKTFIEEFCDSEYQNQT